MEQQQTRGTFKHVSNKLCVYSCPATTTRKRRQLSVGSTSLKLVSGLIDPPQYVIPESLPSLQAMPPSSREHLAQTPPSEILGTHYYNHASISQPEPHAPVRPLVEPGRPRHDIQGAAQSHPSLSNSTYVRQLDEPLGPRSPSWRLLDQSLEHVAQIAAKEHSVDIDSFLELPPSPATTAARGIGLPTPSLEIIAKLPFLLDTTTPPIQLNAAAEIAVERIDISGASRLPGTDRADSMEVPLPGERSSLESDARLSQVLAAVAAAGFLSLEDAVVFFYAQSFENNDFRMGQKLNRIRSLPALLSRLHDASNDWSRLQRRSFQEQIIRSTEDILTSELEDHLITKRTYPQYSTCRTEPLCEPLTHKAESAPEMENELPNTWTFLTSLSAKYNTIVSKDWQTDVPKFVGTVLAASEDLQGR